MDDDLQRLNRLLDDLAAERDPRDRAELSAADVELAQTAAFLKAAHGERSRRTEEFVERLGGQLAAASSAEEHAQRARPDRAPGLSRRGLLGRMIAGAAGFVVGAGAGTGVAYERGQRDGYRQEVSEPFRAPLVPADRGQWLDTGHRAGSVRPGQAVRFRAGAIEGFLLNPGNGGAIYALSAACTHMGCLLSWLDSVGSFLCPCHGAQYNADGTVLSGIARHPLPRLTRPDGMSCGAFRREVEEICYWFTPLSPYEGQPPLLQTEKVNYWDGELEPLFCLAISAKRYVLYNRLPDGTYRIRKFSSHGVGTWQKLKDYVPRHDIPCPCHYSVGCPCLDCRGHDCAAVGCRFLNPDGTRHDCEDAAHQLGGAQWMYDLWYHAIEQAEHIANAQRSEDDGQPL